MSHTCDIVATSGIWPRLVGGACTEITKHSATQHCARNLRLWVWDTDHRGGDGLVPEPQYAAPACLSARTVARQLAERSVGRSEQEIPDLLDSSLRSAFGSLEGEQPLLALATLTSRKTFATTLHLLQRVSRPVLLIGLADFPQDLVSAPGLADRERAGMDLLRQAVSGHPTLAPIMLSRGALTAGETTMDDTAKALFMNILQHLLWLVFTHDEPMTLVRSWYDTIKNSPAPVWSLGHLQLDCSGARRGDPIRGHTWLEAGDRAPYRWDAWRRSVCVEQHNHLGFRADARQAETVTVHAFVEAGRAPLISVPGVQVLTHATYLVDRIDLVFLTRIKPARVEPRGASLQ